MADDCSLKLSQIFRTPKDFSDVNFDDFEIVERNNFDVSTEKTDPVLKNEIFKAPQAIPRSVANAQVMLRFGGDDILGKNHVSSLGKVIGKPSVCYHPDILPHHLPNHLQQFYQFPKLDHYGVRPLSALSLPLPFYDPYHLPPPFAFPGFYYNPMNSPGVLPPIQQNPIALKNGKFIY